MSDNPMFQKLKQEIATAIELLKEKHEGANIDEAKQLLNNAKAAIAKDNYAAAFEFAEKAQLAARPTTEYLLSRAKSLENDGNQAYKSGDLSNAIELWRNSLEEYGRVQELAHKRNEQDIVEVLTATVASIKEDIKTTLVELANKAVDEAREKYDAREFDTAKDKYESARQLYSEGASMARELGSGDKERIREMDAEMASSIETCLIGKGEILFEEASREKGEAKETACLEVMKYLDSFSSDNQDYKELKQKAHAGLATARIETGLGLMADAEKLLNQKEYYQAKDGYRKAQEYLESLSDFVVENRLEKEKGEVDNLIDDCAANIKVCTDSMLGRREKIATGEIRRVEDLRKGIRLPVKTEGFGEDRIEKLKTEYELVRHLGGGGFGDVYLVKNRRGVNIAIKVPRELDRHGEEIFFRELEIWRGLVHRNVVKLICPRINPLPLFEMEYIEGGDLSQLLQNSETFAIDRACRIAFDIARGLQYAHSSHNVIHTDLKPRNILINSLGEAKISDWGLGKIATSSSTVRGYTVAYAAPEQISHEKAQEETDIYQLGVLFFEMLTRCNPFAGGTVEEIKEKVLNLVPEKPSSQVGHSGMEPLDAIVSSCLEKDPKERPSIQQFKEAIYIYMKGSHGESLHLTKAVGSQRLTLCNLALLEAKMGDYVGLLSSLEQLKSLVRDKQIRGDVQNLIQAMAFRKGQGMEINDEAIDELDALMRGVEYGRS